MGSKLLSSAIATLQDQYWNLDWTYHDVQVGSMEEKMYRWPGIPEEEIMIVMHKSNGIQELFTGTTSFILITLIRENMIP